MFSHKIKREKTLKIPQILLNCVFMKQSKKLQGLDYCKSWLILLEEAEFLIKVLMRAVREELSPSLCSGWTSLKMDDVWSRAGGSGTSQSAPGLTGCGAPHLLPSPHTTPTPPLSSLLAQTFQSKKERNCSLLLLSASFFNISVFSPTVFLLPVCENYRSSLCGAREAFILFSLCFRSKAWCIKATKSGTHTLVVMFVCVSRR